MCSGVVEIGFGVVGGLCVESGNFCLSLDCVEGEKWMFVSDGV